MSHHHPQYPVHPSPRPQLRRARRGWILGMLAAVAVAGGVAVETAADDAELPCQSPTAAATTDPDPAAGAPAAGEPVAGEPVAGEPQPVAADAVDEPTSVCAGGTAEDGANGASDQAGEIKPPEPQQEGPGKDAGPATDAGPDASVDPADVFGPAPDDEPVAQDQVAQEPSETPAEPPRRHRRRHAARGAVEVVVAHERLHAAQPQASAPHDQQPPEGYYYPPVSVDWRALTPLAPPPLPGLAADTFPGPLFLLPIYEAAASKYNVPWQVLAAINEVESAWGKNTGPSSAGAIGWMQFMPATWKQYGIDANGDGVENPEDPVDAIFSAARYLHAAHADEDLGRAIYAYNHANRYVDDVVHRAIELGSIRQDVLTALIEQGRHQARAIRRATGSRGLIDRHAQVHSLGQAMLLGDKRLRRLVLHTDAIRIYGCGREDVAAGIIDRRVLEVLRYLVGHGLKPTVTSLRCGHGYYTSSGNVSEHSAGDAVDISAINGIPILGHQGPGSVTETTIRALLKLGGGMKPHQIISLMTFEGADNTLALGDHDDHIHIGFAPRRAILGL